MCNLSHKCHGRLERGVLSLYDKSQLLKGILEGCILKIISDKPTYGYEIVSLLNQYGFLDMTDFFFFINFLFVCSIFSYFVNGFPDTVSITLFRLINILIWFLLFPCILSFVISNIRIPYFKHVLNYLSILSWLFVFAIIGFLVFFLFKAVENIVICTVSGFFPSIFCAGMSVILYWVRFRYYDFLAEKKPWQD